MRDDGFERDGEAFPSDEEWGSPPARDGEGGDLAGADLEEENATEPEADPEARFSRARGEDADAEITSDSDADFDSETEDERKAGTGEDDAPTSELSLEELKKAIEAVLFAVGEPLAIRSIAELFAVSVHDVREAIEELKYEYVDTGRSFRLEEVAGGLQLLTLPAYDSWIRKLRQTQSRLKLSAAAFETLAVIAYKQPITKADLESIRGVQCGPVLKNLLDRGLVRVAGRDESLGRPLLYGTTPRFLESFGIANLRDLPQPDLERSANAAGESESEPDDEDDDA